jgi:hypothetical protein
MIMNAKKSLVSLGSLPLLAFGAISAFPQPSSAATTNITCGTTASTPTVMATISDAGKQKNVAILSFLPQYFSEQSAVQNCQKTAETLKSLYSNGNTGYLTAEKLNRSSVVCAVERRGIGCDRDSARVLFTLDRAENPSQALYEMLGSDFKQSQPPSSRTVSRTYVDIEPRWWFW